jgi:RNA polymerase sigma-70 factor (ECF subfamily)
VIERFPEVLARAQAGDADALTVLYRALNPGLERYLESRAPGSAEDLAADTWIAAAGAIGRFRGDEADFRGWIYTIARNRAVDEHRRSRRRPETAPLDGSADDEEADVGVVVDPAEDAALDALEAEAVLGLVRRLPPDQADVIMLRVVAGLDTDRVARVLGKRPGAVRVLQHRGLRNLERLLGPGRPESGAPS